VFQEAARRALHIEADAITAAASRIGPSFDDAMNLLLPCQRAVVSGIGKSGLVARKIAATLSSTGMPASYLHPTDALHGDIGVVDDVTVAILISNSGETDEVLRLSELLTERCVPQIMLVGDMDSLLAARSSAAIDTSVILEACPLNLAPTASTTAQMAVGDALAVVLMEVKGFTPEQYAEHHPGGALGRRLQNDNSGAAGA